MGLAQISIARRVESKDPNSRCDECDVSSKLYELEDGLSRYALSVSVVFECSARMCVCGYTCMTAIKIISRANSSALELCRGMFAVCGYAQSRWCCALCARIKYEARVYVRRDGHCAMANGTSMIAIAEM